MGSRVMVRALAWVGMVAATVYLPGSDSVTTVTVPSLPFEL